jgi:AcrR family transcriptional regulator
MSDKRASYHHGDLRAALIKAADGIIAEQGIEGFSTREAARRAGVSPGAPAHHFGSAKGLLTEVTLLGYEELGRYLANKEARLDVLSQAYIQFALDHPGHFRLMFRNDLVDRQDARYRAISTRALEPFAKAIASHRAGSEEKDLSASDRLFAIWSTVHGMAHLVLEEKANALFGASDARDLSTNHLPRLLSKLWHSTSGR